MRTRQKMAVDTPPVSVPEIIKVTETPKKSGRGGRRPDSGRKPYSKDRRKESPAYVSMTDAEKTEFRRKARKAKLTLSFFLRKELGLPIDESKNKATTAA